MLGIEYFWSAWGWHQLPISNTPVDVTGLSSGVIGLSAGTLHTCALMAGGGVKCWGYNTMGSLGTVPTSISNTPVDVNGLSGSVTSLAAGDTIPARCWRGLARCAVGEIIGYGQLGDWRPRPDSNVPVISKWLTADGLVEDKKTEVILALPARCGGGAGAACRNAGCGHGNASGIPTGALPNCIPADVALQLEIDAMDAKTPDAHVLPLGLCKSDAACCQQPAVCRRI